MRQLVNPQQLDHNYENPDPEIEIAGGGDAHGSGQREAAHTHGKHQRAFPLQNEIGDLPVARGDHEAKKKSRNFEWHALMLGRVTLLAQ